MFARRISMRLKPNSARQFAEKEEREVLPAIRKQKGFRDLMAFVSPSGTEAFVITLWDGQESAEAYGREGYPRLISLLSSVIDGVPVLDTYNLSVSTADKTAVAATA
jgi:hypothetical protein